MEGVMHIEMIEKAARLLMESDAVLFDLDNTLIETHIDFAEMKRKTLALGVEWGVETDTMRDMDILAIVEQVTAILQSITMSGAHENFHNAAFVMLAAQEAEQCADPILLPGASELLSCLNRRGILVGVVTRNCRMVADRLLVEGDLQCDVLLAREDVAQVKPHPDHLRDALRVLQTKFPKRRLQAQDCLMVGDHVMDIRAGRAAQMRTVGFLRKQQTKAFADCPPDVLLRDVAELWEGVQVFGVREDA